MTPEEKSRQEIDARLTASGWAVQPKDRINLSAARGVAGCELSFATGEPDCTLFVDGKALGTVEAKPTGASLAGVEEQSAKYVAGVPPGRPAWRSPLDWAQQQQQLAQRLREMPPLAVGSLWLAYEVSLAPIGDRAGVTPEQLSWLNLIRDHIPTSLSIEPDDFDYAPFSQRGGLGKAHQLFGGQLPALLDELNTVLAA